MDGLAYSNSPDAFSKGTIADPLRPHLPQDWGSQPPPKIPIAISSRTGEDTDFKFGRYIQRVHPNKSPFNILEVAWGVFSWSTCICMTTSALEIPH